MLDIFAENGHQLTKPFGMSSLGGTRVLLESFSKHNVTSIKEDMKMAGDIHVWEYDAIFTSPLTSHRVC